MSVYVVQNSARLNLTGLFKWDDDPTVIYPADQNIHFQASQSVTHAKHMLDGFSDIDYLVAIGDPAAIGICCAIAAERTHGIIPLLKWDRQERIYYPVKINVR
jgi:hypothetical protein